nr:rho GTPase-activating protein 20-like isoform X1 [Microcebus murinus]XP_012606978.1 rho GTPase-activating protein 20-like isoform X1 [Microcebus murinus]XP_012606979.1 rho GTPase-activating protein 20-like isoform X1 [Microcebus murinus]XP_012606981.1 rho GTPase-activating protein 20-like isoform X1 [Microcebus murinus]XP_012606982.1 rho GTPase-activating protein 20-like isoform X1 [Microcebus murinus]XP_012606983.1 rho GTPase-activating protein 20-like isoform X1 [Microcebus murinus]XP_01
MAGLGSYEVGEISGQDKKMKALVERRRTVPSLLPDKAPQEQPRTNMERSSAAMKTWAFLTAFACSSRTLLIDGLVELRTGLQRQERHLFLFNDLLVVAKSKHNKNNLKMKNKIKLSDMWTASCVDEVGDGKGSAMKSFVLGWPTQNFVATFSSLEQKDTWLSLLQRHIDLEKQKDHPKSIPLRIFTEDMGNCVHYKTVRVTNTDRTNEVIHKLLSVLGVTGTERDYQLCFNSGNEEAAYPLIGHEYPYGIKMKHLRDNALLTVGSRDPTTVFNAQEAFLLEELPGERQCRFILKPRLLAAAQQLKDSHWKTSQKRRCVINLACCWGSRADQDNSLVSLPTSPVAGQLLGLSLENTSENDTHEVVDAPCVNTGKTVAQGSKNMASILKFTDDILKQPEVQDVLNKNDCDLEHCNEEHAQIEDPPESKLFGVSLKNICKNDNLPKPIMDILLFLNEKGPLKEGVFFVPANIEYCRQLKEKLNCGVPVQLYWENAFVLASILMDFLKEIPGSILSSNLYNEWVSVMDNGRDKDKINKIQRLLDKLPRANVVLLNYLFALLYNIEKNSASNQMDSSNLAACVAPTILWPAPSCGPEAENELARKVTLLFQFMLEKCQTVFGEEVTSLYGEFSGTHGTRGNISDVSHFELNDSSSVESLECEPKEDDVYAPFSDVAKDLGHWKTSIQSMLMDVENLEPAEVAYLLSLNDFLLEHPE